MFYHIFICMICKHCSTCKLEKPINQFHKYNKSKDGHTHRCKICVSRKKSIPFDEKKCLICQNIKPLSEFNKRKNGKLGHSSSCKECYNKKTKEWRNITKLSYLEYRRSYRKKRNTQDVSFRLIHNLRCRLSDFLKFRKIKKNNTTINLIGCSPLELKKILESKFTNGMSWENYGYYGWHIDHEIPLSSAKEIEDIYKLFHYTNLQPMWGTDNMKKGKKLSKNESSN